MTLLRSLVERVRVFDLYIDARMLSAAHFLTRTGNTRGENLFWRLAALVAGLGGILALFGEVIGGLSQLGAAAEVRAALIASVGLRALRIYLLYKFIMGMARAIKEPFLHRKPPQ